MKLKDILEPKKKKDPLDEMFESDFDKYVRIMKQKKKLPDNFYNSKEWALARIKVLKRDNYKCVHCGKLANHIDHLNSAYYFPELALNMENLISSCEKCHKFE